MKNVSSERQFSIEVLCTTVKWAVQSGALVSFAERRRWERNAWKWRYITRDKQARTFQLILPPATALHYIDYINVLGLCNMGWLFKGTVPQFFSLSIKLNFIFWIVIWQGGTSNSLILRCERFIKVHSYGFKLVSIFAYFCQWHCQCHHQQQHQDADERVQIIVRTDGRRGWRTTRPPAFQILLKFGQRTMTKILMMIVYEDYDLKQMCTEKLKLRLIFSCPFQEYEFVSEYDDGNDEEKRHLRWMLHRIFSHWIEMVFDGIAWNRWY